MKTQMVWGVLMLTLGATLPAQEKIVTLGGTVTEIVFALGQGDRVAGTDSSSVYPKEATGRLPKAGYVRTLGAEGLVALGAPEVFAIADAGPPVVIEQVKAAGVKWHTVPVGSSWDAAVARIEFLAGKLGAEARGRGVIAGLRDAQRRVQARQQARAGQPAPRVLFVFAHGPGTLMVSGSGTEADSIIRLAGGFNVVQEFSGYKPLTPEALSRLKPQVLLFTHRSLESLGGVEGLKSLPAFADPQVLARSRILAYDDLFLLGFGPRLGEVVETLDRDLYGETK